MSTIKRIAESAENPLSIGRITPLNMRSETNRLNCDALIRDMASANDNDCDGESLHCGLWACAATRG